MLLLSFLRGESLGTAATFDGEVDRIALNFAGVGCFHGSAVAARPGNAERQGIAVELAFGNRGIAAHVGDCTFNRVAGRFESERVGLCISSAARDLGGPLAIHRSCRSDEAKAEKRH